MIQYKHKRKNIMAKSKIIYLPTLLLTLVTATSGAALSTGSVKAESESAEASVTISRACSLGDSEGSGSGYNGFFEAKDGGETLLTDTDSTKTAMVVTCNDPDGFDIMFSGDSEEVTVNGEVRKNYMVGDNGINIATGTTGTDSYWAVKLSKAQLNSGSANLKVADGHAVGTYTEIPNSDTLLVSVEPTAAGIATAEVRTDYKIYVATNQAAGTYTGKVKYTLVKKSGL